jgi:hypothetical protein
MDRLPPLAETRFYTLTGTPEVVPIDDEPARFLAGADAIGLAEQKIVKLREDIESHRDLSTSLGITADDNGVPGRVGPPP